MAAVRPCKGQAASRPGGHGAAGGVMTTPPRVPAGWYADPSARHERRYWDGTDWTAHVADGGVTATDQPRGRPAPASEHAAEPPPAAGPPPDAPAPRKRRTWAVP